MACVIRLRHVLTIVCSRMCCRVEHGRVSFRESVSRHIWAGREPRRRQIPSLTPLTQRSVWYLEVEIQKLVGTSSPCKFDHTVGTALHCSASINHLQEHIQRSLNSRMFNLVDSFDHLSSLRCLDITHALFKGDAIMDSPQLGISIDTHILDSNRICMRALYHSF